MAGVRFRWQVPAWAPGFLVLAVAVLIRVIDPSFVEVWRLSGFYAAPRLLPRAGAGNWGAIAAVPTVLVVAPNREAAPSGPRRITTPVRELGGDPRPFLVKYASLIRTVPEIAHRGRGEGSVGIEPDVDGILRRIPLVIAAEGRLVPAFAATVAARADNQSSLAIRTGDRGVEQV